MTTKRLIQINCHTGLSLLQHCLSVLFSSRHVNAIAVAAKQIINLVLDADTWTIVTMPVKDGGHGLRLPTDVALPAYLASTAVLSYLVDLMLSTNSHLDRDAKMAHWDSTLFPVSNKPSIQSECDATLIRSKRDAVLTHSDQHHSALLLLASSSRRGT